MIIICSPADLNKARLPPNVRHAARSALHNIITAYGTDYPDDNYVVVIDRTTTDLDALSLFGRTWSAAVLEGVGYQRETRCFLTCILFNNESGVSIIVPDAPWLDPAFRAKLVREMGGGDGK